MFDRKNKNGFYNNVSGVCVELFLCLKNFLNLLKYELKFSIFFLFILMWVNIVLVLLL